MRLARKACALFLCALLVLVLLCSSACVVRVGNHVCCGQCCLVCNIIAMAEKILQGFAALLPAVLVLLAAARIWAFSHEAHAFCAYRTLVSWKIRLND